MRSLFHLVVMAVLTSAAGPLVDTTPRMIDDTPEYCRSLANRLAALPAARTEPTRTLGAEGVRLCGDGHVRTGITKLRRAMRAAQARGVPAVATGAGASVEAVGVTR